MKRDLIDILACPICKGPLKLVVQEEDEKEIIKATLICEQEGIRYPVDEGIPNLLPQDGQSAPA